MGKLSQALIDEIDEICNVINNPTTPYDVKANVYKRLEEIYQDYFVELVNKDTEAKGS